MAPEKTAQVNWPQRTTSTPAGDPQPATQQFPKDRNPGSYSPQADSSFKNQESTHDLASYETFITRGEAGRQMTVELFLHYERNVRVGKEEERRK